MSQKEVAVIECDDCTTTLVSEDWPEAHERAKLEGWRIDSTNDYCRECK